MAIPFIDLQAQRARLGEPLNQAILAAVASGQWILGPQVTKLEEELAHFAGVKHAVACANGTDALQLILMAWGIGPGDAVFCPAFTFCATGEVMPLVGATPVFVDVLEDTYNIDPASLEAAIAMVKKEGKLKPKAIIPVDLFGQPADYDAIAPIAAREGLKLLCDTAQGFGATYKGKVTGSIGDAAATSFFPAKPLGCYGDGGACFTNDDETAELLKSIRMHGQGSDRYENVRIGLNSRLDTIQAVILSEKLKIFADEIEKRELVARRYNAGLVASDKIAVPLVIDGCQSVWAQYVIQVPNRDKLQADLKAKGVPTAVYYPIPLSLQKGYAHYPSAPTPVSEKIAKHVVALPMHPYMDRSTQDTVISAVLESVEAS
ncbi:dTDP-4-amino-4,6-dideoxygalactose transaminase [Rhizomicrobium palustre]|uniref:dTDP-4-amino-4,6-dideoxygalactose transaminase n=1 Tax=Rhizomicrobium palustre TaxID=189966 RepID=A0A846MUB1_9PROT|nr:DegT/DnrJ/EryC1/StrS family aminotransferase [Rhizomicrobium palustre]NIK86936.1 dTDP-4-amino-4,6-dideoxygalactose transaminase [Rhizomicrobium palustre]